MKNPICIILCAASTIAFARMGTLVGQNRISGFEKECVYSNGVRIVISSTSLCPVVID